MIKSVGIPIGTNCVHLLADLFLYSYQIEFVLKCYGIKTKPTTKFTLPFNYSKRYIDDVPTLL
jgi:hypothetical protein